MNLGAEGTAKRRKDIGRIFRYVLPVFAILACAGLWQFNAKAANPADAFFTSNPAANIAACAGQSECFAFTIDTRLTSTGATTNTATNFSIPTSGYVGNDEAHAYDWIVNWGDGSAQAISGTSGTISAGISHTYATPGQYQITIRDDAGAADGWLDPFGFYPNVSGANANSNKYMFKSINTPFTNTMRSPGASYRFAYIFNGARNGVGIPTALFADIDTSSATSTSGMFYATFYDFAVNSVLAYIPEGLFDSIDTSSANITASMFYQTFYNYAPNSTGATIPNGLFDIIRLPLTTNTSSMFYQTFYNYAFNSTVGTIPSDLFSGVNPIAATNSSSMFSNTFSQYARNSTVGTIPAGLFDSISTVSGITMTSMFNSTFSSYASVSVVGNIPSGLFGAIDTSIATGTGNMFNATFTNYASNSTVGTIPAGLFDSIDTGSVTNIAAMFTGAFSGYAYNSTVGTIPAGLFDSIDTNGITSLANLFAGTFNGYARSSTVGTIPAGLFDSIDTSSVTNMSNTFSSTFTNYAYGSLLATIPSNLLAGINTSLVTTTTNMFANTFTNYATRKASFSAGGTIINTQSFSSPYATKIGVGGTPASNPAIVAGNVILPSYTAAARTINAPTGIYAGYSWHTKDGTSCAVAIPTADCGPQNAAAPVTFPNSSVWTPTTSTEFANVIFYSLVISPPVITSPTSGLLTNNAAPAVSGTGVAGATVTVTDSDNSVVCTAIVTGGGAWSCTPGAALSNGTHIFKSTQTDVIGNISNVSNSVSLIVDTIPPSSLVSVNTTTNGINQPIVSFTTYDNIAVSHSNIYYNDINGDPAIATNVSSPTTLDLDPSETVHTITVRTYDTAGNYYDNEITFPPIVTFSLPTPISNTTINDATVTVTTPSGNDILSVVLDPGVSSATLTNCVGAGGDLVAPYAQPVTCQILNVDAYSTIKVTAVDAGNGAVGYNNASFIIDTAAPIITTLTPTLESNAAITDTVITVNDNFAVNADDVIITATSISGSFGIAAYNCTQIYTSTVECTVTTTGTDGTGSIVVTATDVAGNSFIETITGFVIDSTPPSAPVVSPSDGTSVSGTAELGSTITVTYTDESGVEHTLTTVVGAGGTWSIALEPPARPGSNISVTATDQFGNISSTTVVAVPGGGTDGGDNGGGVTPPGVPNTGSASGASALIALVATATLALMIFIGKKLAWAAKRF